MLVRLIAFHFCFIGLIALAGAAPLPFETVFKGRSHFDRLVVQARANDWASLRRRPDRRRRSRLGRDTLQIIYTEIDNHAEAPSVNFYGMTAGRFSRSRSALLGCSTIPQTSGPRRACSTISSSIDIGTASVRANIFHDCTTWKIGWRITTGVVWLKT